MLTMTRTPQGRSCYIPLLRTATKRFVEAMKVGMTAIAAPMGSDDKLVDVIKNLQASQEASCGPQAHNSLADTSRD